MCFAKTGELNVNGCSYVPDTLFNRVSRLCYQNQTVTKYIKDETIIRDFHFHEYSILISDETCSQAACDIHDLCYVTPGATKEGCDRTFVENIILIYWYYSHIILIYWYQ